MATLTRGQSSLFVSRDCHAEVRGSLNPTAAIDARVADKYWQDAKAGWEFDGSTDI